MSHPSVICGFSFTRGCPSLSRQNVVKYETLPMTYNRKTNDNNNESLRHKLLFYNGESPIYQRTYFNGFFCCFYSTGRRLVQLFIQNKS